MKKLMLGLVFALAVAVSIGVLSAGAVTSNKAVSVKLNEFNVLPGVQGAPAGKVTFTVKNSGKIEHEFVVLRTLRSAGGLMGKSGEASEAGNVCEIGSVKPGQQKKLTLTLKKGHYSILCNLPGHYKGGQFADFYVR
ncbi:MAG: cupredoxin domain-containing protein [Thermoleophilia bacterium]|nr:cupredoxin domain-containing protein [Thermoleophilia bacterium]